MPFFPVDLWGNPYHYRHSENKYDLFSAGSDREVDTFDDIRSEDPE